MTESSSDARFLTTRWSLVLRAGEVRDAQNGVAPSQALEELCHRYWFPLYAFARRQGHHAADAQDLVQGFLLDLLEREGIATASAKRGRFRNFLLKSFRNFQSKERERNAAQKRGGSYQLHSFEGEAAEIRFQQADPAAATPEQLFLRTWTMDLLAAALEDLRQDYERRDQERIFLALQDDLAEGRTPDYTALSETLDLSVGSVRVALHRLRGRYRDAIRQGIADTLDQATEDEVERELAELLQALSSPSL